MIELTTSSTAPSSRSSPDRRSFRRRLLILFGPALAGVLLLLGLVAWGTAYVALQRSAVAVLRAEADEVENDIVRADSTLQIGGHTWAEVHHRLADRRVDPVFVQVFDRYNRVLRASTNIDSLSALYPEQLLVPETTYDWIPTLRTIEVGGRTLYYLVRPLVAADGRTLGYIQVARAVPDYSAALTVYGVLLAGGVVVLFGGLLGLVAWAARRVLRPLRRITSFAEDLTSTDLDARLDVPPKADRETALLTHTLNALLDRLEDRFEALRTFTANAAHELQTPLTVLQGHVEIALRRSRSAESYESTLRLLDRRLEEMVRTVRALLTLTRLDQRPSSTEGPPLSTEPVPVGRLVATEADDARPAADEKGLALRVETEEAWVDGQADLLREAVHNLIDNAIKYTDAGDITLTVEPTDGQVVLHCRDTGMGIEAEALPQVGARFYRSTDASSAEPDGSGLGLALVRRIVDAHGGTLRIDSTPGAGTTVEVVLDSIPPPTDS
jgi:signal transduction histidine kinase